MDTPWSKMQISTQERFLVINAPQEAAAAVRALESERSVDRSPVRETYDCIISFVTDERGITETSSVVKKHGDGDNTLVWVLYPKKSSKKYQADISRDSGWNALLDLGWDGVRQIAFDEDWSALRFRPTTAIKSYTRKKRLGGDA